MLAATVAEQPHLGFAERVLALVVLQQRSTPSTRSLPRIGTRCDRACSRRCRGSCSIPDASSSAARVRRRQRRRVCSIRSHGPAGLGGIDGGWSRCAVLELVQVVDQIGLRSYQRMPMSPCWNTSRSLSPTRSTIAWKLSSAAMPFLDAVDDRQLGGALLGLLQQALRLVEEAGVLQRDAHAARRPCSSRRTLGLAERVLALVVLDADRSRARDRR